MQRDHDIYFIDKEDWVIHRDYKEYGYSIIPIIKKKEYCFMDQKNISKGYTNIGRNIDGLWLG